MTARGALRLVSSALAVSTAAACSLFYSFDELTSSDDAGTSSPDAGSPDAPPATDAGDASSFDAAALPDGLIAHWPFEGSAADVTGRGHSLLGVKTLFVDGGIRGGAVRCADLGSHLESTSPDLVWGPNGVTVLSWVKLEPKDGGGSNRTIFQSGRNADWTNGVNKTLGFGMGRPGGGIIAHIADGGAEKGLSVTGPPDDGAFHAIAYVGSPAAFEVYVDGVSTGRAPLSDAGALVDPAPLFQLCGNGNEIHFLGGLLDEVMMWNRALSAPEIESVIAAIRTP